MFSVWWDSTAGLLVGFDQHATGLHVSDVADSLPYTGAISVDDTRTTTPVPPSTVPPTVAGSGAVDIVDVVVAVWSAKHHSVGNMIRIICNHESISGVTAVPVHRQLILANLITDGERRVFSPVPLTVSTTDLHRHSYNTSNILTTRWFSPSSQIMTGNN